MRLALVYPFWKLETDSAPTQAMDVVAGGHATEMSRLAAVDVYLRGEGGRSQRVDESGVTFHRLSGRPEQLMRPLQRMRYKVLGVEEGEERQVGHMAYAWQAALAMRRTGADAAQVYIFDSYLPVLRRMNPELTLWCRSTTIAR